MSEMQASYDILTLEPTPALSVAAKDNKNRDVFPISAGKGAFKPFSHVGDGSCLYHITATIMLGGSEVTESFHAKTAGAAEAWLLRLRCDFHAGAAAAAAAAATAVADNAS